MAALASISLFYVRARNYYEKGLGLASIAYAFFDVLFVFGLIGIMHFGILLPVLDPARMARIGGVKVGFNEVIFASVVMLVTRPFIQLALRSQEQRRQQEILETQRMLALLENISRRIEELSKPLHDRGEAELKRHLDILLKRLEELRDSMATRTAVYAKPVAIQPAPAQVLEPKKSEVSVKVVEREVTGAGVESLKPNLPDAAIDNPWMNVLKNRKRGKR
ncbi:MAG: hypothetical protein J7J94_00680 [Thaumarchaeota archaeon]|nr:hypothetical protein [Nitrososphaerota archaeon]